MTNNSEHYIDRLIALRNSLDAKHGELQSKLNDVARDLEAVSRTLALLDEASLGSNESDAPSDTGVAPIDTLSVQGLTQLGALIKIAQHNGGRMNASDAKKILVRAGLTKSEKNATNIIFNVIQRSNRFRRVEPGIYELVENKPQRPAANQYDAMLNLSDSR